MNITSKQLMNISCAVALCSLVWSLPKVAASPFCIILPFVFIIAYLYCQKEHTASEYAFLPKKPILCLYALWALINVFLYFERFSYSLKITVMKFSPKWFLSGVIAITALYLLTRKRPLKTAVRMAEIIYPFSLFVIILFFVMLIPFISSDNLHKIKEIKSSFDLSAMAGITSSFSPIFLPVLMGKKAEFSFSRAVKYTAVFFVISAFYILLFLLLPSVDSSLFSLFTLSKAVNVLGVLERPEGLAVIVSSFLILLSSLFYISLFCYLAKEISGRKTKCFAGFMVIAVFIISAFVNTGFDFLRLETLISYINLLFSFFIPLVIMLTNAILNLRGEEKC